MSDLYREWINLKAAEKAMAKQRRELEDKMLVELKINELKEGTETIKDDGFKIKVITRLNKKVDADKLQEIAQENGTFDFLTKVFRWKAEVKKAVWDSTDSAITAPYLQAIETKPGRPSFSIEKEK